MGRIGTVKIEKWNTIDPKELSPDTPTKNLLKFQLCEGVERFVASTQDGEVLIALEEEVIRISMQRPNGTYCLFELTRETLLSLQRFSLSELRDAIYEDPIISALTREQALEYIGIPEVIK